MRVERVDDQLQQLIDFGLKFTFRHIYGLPEVFVKCPYEYKGELRLLLQRTRQGLTRLDTRKRAGGDYGHLARTRGW
jgi:hypothetical protein